jgi:transcriptional regulator with XRE-family HTH domain
MGAWACSPRSCPTSDVRAGEVNRRLYRVRYISVYGQLIRRARSQRGLTQTELALISGIEQSNISAVENERRMPSAETLHRLLFACGFELAGVAGSTVVACPPPERGAFVGDVDELAVSEAPTATATTPIADRVRMMNAALDAAEAIVRSR